MLKDGNPRYNCLALLDACYARHTRDRSVAEKASEWFFLWKDLQDKSRGQPDRAHLLQLALASELPVELRPTTWKAAIELSRTGIDHRTQADVIIITIIETEFNSALAAFGIQQSSAETIWIFGHPFVQTTVETQAGPLSVWICLVGAPRNLPCTHFCRDLFEKYYVRLGCILVGIAAGHPDKLKLGDVVGARSIWDIEGGSVTSKGERPRPKPYSMKPTLEESFLGFNPVRWSWLAPRDEAIGLLQLSGEKLPPQWDERETKYQQGVIVAGEKLRRDDPLPRLRRRYNDEIVALEMEGSGFAAACLRKEIPWFVFRGISDHGTKRKRDEWQSLAALHAALAARSFIEHRLFGTAAAERDIPI